jgi:hypothetical protein
LEPLEICPSFSHFQFSKLEELEELEEQDFEIDQFSDDDVPAPDLAGNDDEDEAVQQQEANLMEEILAQDGEDGDIAPTQPVINSKVFFYCGFYV